MDSLVAHRRFRNRRQAIETALAEKLTRLARTRLAEECAKLDRTEERRLADEGLSPHQPGTPRWLSPERGTALREIAQAFVGQD